MQNDGAYFTGDFHRVSGSTPSSESERRRQLENGTALPSDEHPYTNSIFPGRTTRPNSGSEVEVLYTQRYHSTSLSGLPLTIGNQGEDVLDLQQRLSELGYDITSDPPGYFGNATLRSVRAFQDARKLRVDGICGPQTWQSLVEAGYRLGDRLLYRRTPMLRGDDVAELQRRLGSLGFDAGRIDGIFGDRTATALAEFQNNVGLPADAIFGRETYNELVRLQLRKEHKDKEIVRTVKDFELLHQPRSSLNGYPVAISEEGGLGVLVAAMRRRLQSEGANVITLSHPDSSELAQRANLANVSVLIGFRLDPDNQLCRTAFYSGYQYESTLGRHLAELAQKSLVSNLNFIDATTIGMYVPLLRETSMPAIICEIGPTSVVVQQPARIADAIVQALNIWVSSTWS